MVKRDWHRLPPSRGAGFRRAAAGALAASALASCASPGPPQTLRFASNREPAEAFACATRRLRLEGFEIVESSAEAGSALALRRAAHGPEPATDEWWRVELSVALDPEGRTLVEAVTGIAPAREGPYTEPTPTARSTVARVTASCTW